MIEYENRSTYNVANLIQLLESIQNFLVQDKVIELLFLDEEAMRKLNLEQRNLDQSTDVLSFPLLNNDFNHLGSIVINLSRAQAVANDLDHSLEAEVQLLFIHGLLHLLGFDHEKDDQQMRDKEYELVRYFDLPDSLILRSELAKAY